MRTHWNPSEANCRSVAQLRWQHSNIQYEINLNGETKSNGELFRDQVLNTINAFRTGNHDELDDFSNTHNSKPIIYRYESRRMYYCTVDIVGVSWVEQIIHESVFDVYELRWVHVCRYGPRKWSSYFIHLKALRVCQLKFYGL